MKKILKVLLVTLFILININIVHGEQNEYTPEEKPDISSEYVYMYDFNTKQVLWDIGSDEVIYPASLTKMMTLIVAIENIDDVNKTVLITEEMLNGLKEARASRAGFDIGDEPLLMDVLYGIILPSGADCTNAVAYYVSGGLEQYVSLMNQKAKELGMMQTNFENVTGLHNEKHVSSLKDMSKLLEYCLNNETFVKIFSSKEHQAIPTLNYKEGLKMESNIFKYINNNDPNIKYNVNIDGFIGGKSGYTTAARYCLASSATYDGTQYVLLTAHSWIERVIPSHILDAGLIYNYYFDKFENKTVYSKDEVINSIPVHYNFFNKEIDVKPNEDITKILPNDNNLHVEIDLPKEIYAPIKQGDKLGDIKVYSYDNLVYESDLYSNETINRSFIAFILTNVYWFVIDYKTILVIGLLLLILLIVLLKLIYEIKVNNRKFKKKK